HVTSYLRRRVRHSMMVLLFVYVPGDRHDLPSFPTRRSSDLSSSLIVREPLPEDDPRQRQPDISKARRILGWEPEVPLEEGLNRRSEEHTSELQSRFDLVCRLLLDKKKHPIKAGIPRTPNTPK